jgi:hypothetical protein
MPFGLVFNRNRAHAPIEESPAFAHVAERFRRAGELPRAVSLCRDGLRMFPDHVSGRVTLGLALVDLGKHAEARRELQHALKLAPDNLAAIRGMAHLHDHHDHQDHGESHSSASEALLPSDALLASEALPPSGAMLPSDAPLASDALLPSDEMRTSDEWFAPMDAFDPTEAVDPMPGSAPMQELFDPMPASAPMPAPAPMEVSASIEASEFDALDLDALGPDDEPGEIDPVVRLYREALPLSDQELDVMAIGLEMDALDARWSEQEVPAPAVMQVDSAMRADVVALERFLNQVQTRRMIA